MLIRSVMLARAECLESRLFLSTYYVSSQGNDAGTGSIADPFLTLQQAADTVDAGDTVIVERGTYAGFNLRTSGTPSARITFHAEPGTLINERSLYNRYGINLDGASYITIEGFKVAPDSTTMMDVCIRTVENTDVIIRNNIADHASWWGILASFTENVVIENNTASNSIVQHGIYVSDSSHSPVIRNNLIFGNRQAGIHLNGGAQDGGDGLITNALIEYNTIYDNGARGGSGINGDGVQNSTIQHNLLYGNIGSGISLYRTDGRESSTNNLVLNNTIVMPSGGRWAINIQDGSTGNVLYNNILVNQHPWRGSINISLDSLRGFVSNYNVLTPRFSTIDIPGEMGLSDWRSETRQDLDSIVSTASSLFVDPAKNDYRLSPTSPAIDAGNPLTYCFREPSPNGGRINIGHQGNTPQATTSPVQSIQLLSPSGDQRLKLGQPIALSWQSAGLARQKPIALINAGSLRPVGDYLPDAYQLIT
ncbi:MAG: nitrous oxide reductase family maturation protein NosD, partial [Bacillota bacterium]